MKKQIEQIVTDELAGNSVSRKAEWWNNYLKDKISFMGLGIPEIRKVLLSLNRTNALEELPMNQQVSLVKGLMKGHFAEQKLAAVLYMQLFWLGKQRPSFLLNLIADWFDEQYIFDWNTTDWLSVKILAPLVDSGEKRVIWTLKKWNRDPYLWKARASLVPFAQVAAITGYTREIEHFSDILIRRKERFAKTAVGWVLREYSKVDEEFVLDFLSRHVKYTTAEVKRNALKYYRLRTRENSP